MSIKVCGYIPFQTLEMEATKGPGMSLSGEKYLRTKYRRNNIITTNGIQDTGRLELWEPTSRGNTSGFVLMSAIAIVGLVSFFWFLQ